MCYKKHTPEEFKKKKKEEEIRIKPDYRTLNLSRLPRVSEMGSN